MALEIRDRRTAKISASREWGASVNDWPFAICTKAQATPPYSRVIALTSDKSDAKLLTSVLNNYLKGLHG